MCCPCVFVWVLFIRGDDNENRGAIPCQLLILIGSDLWKKKKKASVQGKAASDDTALKEVCCRKITFGK